mgnify:FL=1
MSEIRYTIPLVPVSKKNSQQIMVNRKTGKPFIMPSQKFRQYERDARIFLRPIPAEPIDRPVEIEYKFWMPTRRRVDLTNLMEAADDLLEAVGIIADDNSRIVVGHDGSRVLYDPDSPRVEITITPMYEDGQMGLFAGDGHERF